MRKGKRHGWGRYFYFNYINIGWFKDGSRCGNNVTFENGVVNEKGWYQVYGGCIAELKKDS